MLAGMETFEESTPPDPTIDPTIDPTRDAAAALDPTSGPLVTAFEPCVAFDSAGHGSPECLGCGWLEHEHRFVGDEAVAGVRPLPPRAHTRHAEVAERLAS